MWTWAWMVACLYISAMRWTGVISRVTPPSPQYTEIGSTPTISLCSFSVIQVEVVVSALVEGIWTSCWCWRDLTPHPKIFVRSKHLVWGPQYLTSGRVFISLKWEDKIQLCIYLYGQGTLIWISWQRQMVWEGWRRPCMSKWKDGWVVV